MSLLNLHNHRNFFANFHVFGSFPGIHYSSKFHKLLNSMFPLNQFIKIKWPVLNFERLVTIVDKRSYNSRRFHQGILTELKDSVYTRPPLPTCLIQILCFPKLFQPVQQNELTQNVGKVYRAFPVTQYSLVEVYVGGCEIACYRASFAFPLSSCRVRRTISRRHLDFFNCR